MENPVAAPSVAAAGIRFRSLKETLTVAAKELIVDPAVCDFDRPIATVEEIRKRNPQRFEMEQLTAIVYLDAVQKKIAGYKDVRHDEFWVRGHMPNMPLMPGVLMIEAAAQLLSFFAGALDLTGGKVVGFGGLEEVSFRGPVIPGDRLFISCEATKIRAGRMIISRFQGLVRQTLVVDGILKGIVLPVDLPTAINGPSGDSK